jgi:DNA-binding transcriptional regulator YhcF (GntR family)
VVSIDEQQAPYQLIAAGLRNQILAGHLTVGTKLPSEHELAAKHHVARATAQSALRQLRSEGLTTSRKGAGNYVASAPAADIGRCPAHLVLAPAQIAWLGTLPMPAHGLDRVLHCELERAHPGPHAGLGQHAGDTPWWVQWTLAASEIVPVPMCPAQRIPEGTEVDDNKCLLFQDHAGRHLFGGDYV